MIELENSLFSYQNGEAEDFFNTLISELIVNSSKVASNLLAQHVVFKVYLFYSMASELNILSQQDASSGL